MILLAALQLLSTLVIPVLFVVSLWRRRGWHVIACAVGMLLALPFLRLWRYMSPFDFVLPGRVLRVETDVQGFHLAAIQIPDDVDFYLSALEITRPDGLRARWWFDFDDNKWWQPYIVASGSRVAFCNRFEAASHPWLQVDLQREVITAGARSATFAELAFRELPPLSSRSPANQRLERTGGSHALLFAGIPSAGRSTAGR